MKIARTKAFKVFFTPIWESNPVSGQILGICSALAVTVQLKTAVVMSLALTFVLAFSNLSISLMRNLIPRNIRIIIELTVIATLVIFADQVLRAFLYNISKQLSIFVGLIITNCIVLGRAEAFASKNSVTTSLIDGFGIGLGFTFALLLLGSIREILGSGSIFNIKFIQGDGILLFVSPPGAFLALGFLIMLMNKLSKKIS